MPAVNQLVDHFFRREYGKLVSKLTAKYGVDYLDEVEDAIQEAMARAIKTWPFSGVPESPTAWFIRVSNNVMIDQMRKKKIRQDHINPITKEWYETSSDNNKEISDHLTDDELLPLLFCCCHPELSDENQIILCLKILCGFGMKEISQSLFKSESAVARAYTRSKEKFKELNIKLELPDRSKLNERLDSVIKVIYLLYNEGYKPAQGESLVNRDICDEAIRLAEILIKIPAFAKPQLLALAALMYFQRARFTTRSGPEGELVPLKDQDRSKWDKEMIAKGTNYLNRSTASKVPTEYHIQAGIAYNHSVARDYESTDWKQILTLYNMQRAINPSSISELNRLVALSKVQGPEIALAELDKSDLEQTFLDYYLFFAIKGDLLEEAGRRQEAIDSFLESLEKVKNISEKAFIKKRLDQLH